MLEMKKIHEDKRGEIYSILIEGRDIAILTTKKGCARGGHFHPEADEYFIVIEGMVKYFIGEKSDFYHEGMSDVVLKGEPHYFVAHTDSIVLHWGTTTTKTVIDEGYRARVEAINKEAIKGGVRK